LQFNAPITGSSSALDTVGTPAPLAYGYAWATGKRFAYYQLGEPETTGNQDLDFTRVGLWLLGHGEWDGCQELWINDVLVWDGSTEVQSNWLGQIWTPCLDNASQGMVFNFHRGADSVIGSGLVPRSNGPDQGTDVLFAQLPPAIQIQNFSRIAYYAIMRKQPIENQTNTHQNDPSQWTDIAPIGLWRALRCRLFDAEGNQTGYAFTTNPAWHFVDVLLRRKIFPDFGLDLVNGPDPLPQAMQNRFDWGSIYTAAQYFDEFLTNGRRRFEGSYSFSSQSTLQAVLEQILLCCRSFMAEYAGKISLNCDMPRSSVFTFSREHILPGSWNANDEVVHKSANRYVATFRDLMVPACSQVQSFVWPTVTTVDPHPFQPGDRICFGATDSPMDGGSWLVNTVPDVINPGQPDEVDPVTFTLVSKGENYPFALGAGGYIGLLYSRFSKRTPMFDHQANQFARGAVGLGIARQREKVKQGLDFATCTWDQAARLTMYERDKLLGIDPTNDAGQIVPGSPYIVPPRVKFKTSMFAIDAFGNLACAIRPGDHVTLDNTLNFQYTGEYEALDPLIVTPPGCQASGSGGAIAIKPDDNSGEIEFSLGPYNEDVMYDESDPTQAGWPDVPGSDPGNNDSFTNIPLTDGVFAFFTGLGTSGSKFQLPSTGFPPANVLAWAGPAGYLFSDHQMNTIALCNTDATLSLILNYLDGDGNVWNGDVNYACLTWLSVDVPATSGGLNWLVLTLLGGEEICFGQGIVAGDGSFTVELPAGFTTDKMFAVAYPHDGVSDDGFCAHQVGAFVDDDQVVHLNYWDGVHEWHGNASVLVFAWKNNMGSVTTESLDGGNWMQCTLTNGQIFGVGTVLGVADGDTVTLPAGAGDGVTLEAMVGPSGWDLADSGHEATGVKTCYLDADNLIHMQFGNNTGSIVWSGAADVFALYCSVNSSTPVVVNVTPLSQTVPAGANVQFNAAVLGSANPNVVWSVDGIAGGNVTVGTVNALGYYSAPNVAGSHTITATSVADPSASGSGTVTVVGTLLPDPGNILSTGGIPIVVNGDEIEVD
jgi:hypothetical protein